MLRQKTTKKTRKNFAIKKDAFSALSNLSVLVVSQWTSGSAKKSAIFNDTVNHSYIYNWIDLEIFKPCGDQAKVRENFDFNKQAEKYLKLYQEISKKRK